jgi:hypothetical protein
VKIVSVEVKTISPSGTSLPPSSSVDLCKEANAHYLRQAYLEYESDEVVVLDLSGDDDFKNTYIQAEGIIGYYRTTMTAVWNADRNKWYWKYEKAPNNFLRMVDVLRDKLHDQEGNIYDNYQCVFYLDRAGGSISFTTERRLVDEVETDVDVRNFNSLGGYSSSDVRTVVLFKDIEADTVTHELGHALTLPHTFTNKTAEGVRCTTVFTFEAMTTDNIMDYSHMLPSGTKIPMNCFFYWQWIEMNRSIDSNGNIMI